MSRKSDREEQAVREDFERGEYASVLTEARRRALARAAARTFRKDRRINIRLSGHDLEALQRRALREGMPYQTLVASILHKYVTGVLKEVEPAPGEGEGQWRRGSK